MSNIDLLSVEPFEPLNEIFVPIAEGLEKLEEVVVGLDLRGFHGEEDASGTAELGIGHNPGQANAQMSQRLHRRRRLPVYLQEGGNANLSRPSRGRTRFCGPNFWEN